MPSLIERLGLGRRKQEEPSLDAVQELYGEISRLAPQLQESGRTSYRSSTLGPLLLGDNRNQMLKIIDRQVNLRGAGGILVSFRSPLSLSLVVYPEEPPHEARRIEISVDKTTHKPEKVTLDGSLKIADGFISNPEWISDLFGRLKKDLEHGRKEWVESLRQARDDYPLTRFESLSEPIREEARDGINSVLRAMARALPNDQFLVFGTVVDIRDKKTVVNLLTTLPIKEETVEKIHRMASIGKSPSFTSEYRRILNFDEGRYVLGDPFVVGISLESIVPPRRVDQLLEIDFETFLSGARNPREGFAIGKSFAGSSAELLWSNPDTSPIGPIFSPSGTPVAVK